MNARSPAPLAEPEVDLIPVDGIAPSQTQVQQLRRKRFDPAALADLAASLLKSGQLQPVVVRPHPDGTPQYELVLGERRWLAARLAGLKLVEAKIRALDDAAVLEAQMIENLQREELHPLEEAAGYDEMIRVAGVRKEDVGERLGKSRSWVYARLGLLRLDEPAREALAAGRLDVSRAMVIASVAQPNQRARALELALEAGSNDKPLYSVRELRQKIVEEKLCLPLVGAPFDHADATLLPEMGACGPCPHRSENCDPGALDPNVCTNLACFHLKVKAAGERKRAAILEGGGKVLRGEEARRISPSVKTVYGHVDLDLVCGFDEFPEPEPKIPGDQPDAYGESTHPDYLAWREREKLWQPRTYRALLAGEKLDTVVIEDPKTKAVRELLPFAAAQKLLKKKGISLPSYANRKRHSFSGGGSQGAQPEDADKRRQREAAEAKKRAVEIATRERIFKAVYPKASAKIDKELLLQLARDGNADEAAAIVFGDTPLEKLKEADLVRCIRMSRFHWVVQNAYEDRDSKELYALAKKLKINVDALRKEAAKTVAAEPTTG